MHSAPHGREQWAVRDAVPGPASDTLAAMRGHGQLTAGEVGELVGVPGTTIGQWARWGYVRASVSEELPHVYGVEDVGEASIVAALLGRGVPHAEVRRAITHLVAPWPLSGADLATTRETRPQIVLDGAFALGGRGWQRLVVAPALDPVRLRLRVLYDLLYVCDPHAGVLHGGAAAAHRRAQSARGQDDGRGRARSH